jgi:hypothetical protein
MYQGPRMIGQQVPHMTSQSFQFRPGCRAVPADLARFAERHAHEDLSSSLIKSPKGAARPASGGIDRAKGAISERNTQSAAAH